jgi:hypothetical protein
MTPQNFKNWRTLALTIGLSITTGALVAAVGEQDAAKLGKRTHNHDAPFGGVGNSGMGTYHGEEGFCELSHAKTVFKRHRFFPIGLFYPPYGNVVQRLALRLFLGSADPKL